MELHCRLIHLSGLSEIAEDLFMSTKEVKVNESHLEKEQLLPHKHNFLGDRGQWLRTHDGSCDV